MIDFNFLNDLKTSQQIYNVLLKTSELKESDNKQLFLSYINNENVRSILNVITEESKCQIKNSGSVLYLIPDIDNDIFKFNINSQKYKHMLGESIYDKYLCNIIIAVIFNEFSHDLITTNNYIEIVEIINLVSNSLDKVSMNENLNEIEENYEFNIKKPKEIWDSKPKWDEYDKVGKQTTSTKYQIGCIRKVINFLKNEDLFIIPEDEDIIIPTTRFKDLMCFYRDCDRKNEIENLLKGRFN